MTTESDMIRATDAVRELAAMYGERPPVNERSFHNMILNAKIPAVRGADGKFRINRSDLPAIAETIGMTIAA